MLFFAENSRLIESYGEPPFPDSGSKNEDLEQPSQNSIEILFQCIPNTLRQEFSNGLKEKKLLITRFAAKPESNGGKGFELYLEDAQILNRFDDILIIKTADISASFTQDLKISKLQFAYKSFEKLITTKKQVENENFQYQSPLKTQINSLSGNPDTFQRSMLIADVISHVISMSKDYDL